MYWKKALLLLVISLAAAVPAAEKYQAPKLSSQDSWSMIVLPDTQNYIKFRRNYGILDLMIGWIYTNAGELRIQQVLTGAHRQAFSPIPALRCGAKIPD